MIFKKKKKLSSHSGIHHISWISVKYPGWKNVANILPKLNSECISGGCRGDFANNSTFSCLAEHILHWLLCCKRQWQRHTQRQIQTKIQENSQEEHSYTTAQIGCFTAIQLAKLRRHASWVYFEKYTFDKYTFRKYAFRKYTFGKYTFGKYTFGKYTFRKYTWQKYTFGKYTFGTHTHALYFGEITHWRQRWLLHRNVHLRVWKTYWILHILDWERHMLPDRYSCFAAKKTFWILHISYWKDTYCCKRQTAVQLNFSVIFKSSALQCFMAPLYESLCVTYSDESSN